MVQYGPVVQAGIDEREAVNILIAGLKKIGERNGCRFIRISPFWKEETAQKIPNTISSPLHLLAEYLWYLTLTGKTEESLLRNMRKTTRNLIGRAEREGVTIEASKDPMKNLPHFLSIHEETRKRHGFTPYTDDFFRSQVEQFSRRNECMLYLAWYQQKVVAASIHMHAFGETSYHHGASSNAFGKIPASYLLQWTAIRDALKRRDRIYNFWGIAPLRDSRSGGQAPNPKHPFAGVTLFKTGFGGELLPLVHCMDLPLSRRYYLTRSFELLRKWRRGF